MLERMDEAGDDFKTRVRRVTGYRKPLTIVPYFGYGIPEKFILKGRVLANRTAASAASAQDSRWRNLLNTFRHFETDEVPNARVKALFQDAEWETETDEEGYFDLEIAPPRSLDKNAPWQNVELELVEPVARSGERARAAAQVSIPPDSARFGVISDIDDTVLQSNIANKLKMILQVALLNEHTRVPFKGVAAFYRALLRGAGGNENNPVFYVSSSPWNLYAPLVEFLKVHDIPLGPLFLKDFGNHILFTSKDHKSHKMSSIRRILETYPHLRFILIGDSGEQDPEIYRETVSEFPERIRAIYIRSINTSPERLAAIDKLIDEVKETGCQLVLAPDTEFAAAHAAGEGLISTAELQTIRSEKEKDENAPSAKEFA